MIRGWFLFLLDLLEHRKIVSLDRDISISYENENFLLRINNCTMDGEIQEEKKGRTWPREIVE